MNDPKPEGHMASHIGRREFLATLGGAAAAWPFTARAQQAGRLPTIGLLGAGTPSAWSPWLAAFAQRLHELGWSEGRTIAIKYRWAEGRTERYAEIAAEFVRLKVDVIVTGGAAVPAVKQATSVIPTVFAVADDAVGTGLVASLARPGGNVTGLSNQQVDLVGKRIELLRELFPGLRRLAIMANTDAPGVGLEMAEAQTVAGRLGLQVVTSAIRRAVPCANAASVRKVPPAHGNRSAGFAPRAQRQKGRRPAALFRDEKQNPTFGDVR
jgi:ABC-type uncharacterized transport system substrate-binding protein